VSNSHKVMISLLCYCNCVVVEISLQSHRYVEGNTCMACIMYILPALDTVQFSILISEQLKFHPLCHQTLVMESGGVD
jgi:hypothetical protein